jgi:hypothetical protein
MQAVGQVADGVGERRGALLQRRQRVDLPRHLRSVERSFEAAQDDADARQLLAHVVVQVAGDARALLLLGVDQAAGEVAILLV